MFRLFSDKEYSEDRRRWFTRDKEKPWVCYEVDCGPGLLNNIINTISILIMGPPKCGVFVDESHPIWREQMLKDLNKLKIMRDT